LMQGFGGAVVALLLSFISFSRAQAQAQTGSLWSPARTPADIVDPGANSVGLGVEFTGANRDPLYERSMNAGNHMVVRENEAGDGDLDQ
jgi:hypothetical protein